MNLSEAEKRMIYQVAVSYTHLDVYKRQEPELTHDPNKINYSVKLNPGRSESRSESGTPKSAS